MIYIGICEDEPDLREYYHTLILEWAKKKKVSIRISSYESSEQLLFSYDEKEPFDILVLDIQMKEINGMELAKQLRENDSHMQFIFLTGLKEYALEGYEVGAFRYLIKPVKEKEFFDILTKVCERVGQEKKQFMTVCCQGEARKIDYENIFYVEARGHYIAMSLADEELEWKGCLMELAGELEENGLALSRRGLYINLRHVKQIGRTECLLDNGIKLPVSRGCYKAFNDKFIGYYKEADW